MIDGIESIDQELKKDNNNSQWIKNCRKKRQIAEGLLFSLNLAGLGLALLGANGLLV